MNPVNRWVPSEPNTVYQTFRTQTCSLTALVVSSTHQYCAVSCRLFLHSVFSALLGVGLVLVVASYVFVEFFVDPSSLRTDQHFLCKTSDVGLLS